ncbi:SprT-like domain-containing protein [Halorhodospira neutriphila]|nr:SprT-like domain-containing protein [Halorhodospira neutriphila]
MSGEERVQRRMRTVEAAVGDWWWALVAAHPALGRRPVPGVEWLARGSSAGRADLQRWVVAFNRPLLAREDGYRTLLPETVVHELAHLAAFHLHGSRGHDRHWRALMAEMGLPAQRTHGLDVTGLPGVQRRWRYRCACGEHALSTTRHNRIRRGTQRYYCNRCRGELVRAEE